MSTHDDDEAIIMANRFITTSKDRRTTELVRSLVNRIGEKKVEMRGLEGQVSTLKAREAELENAFIHHYEDGGCDPRYQDLYERVAHSIVIKQETENERRNQKDN